MSVHTLRSFGFSLVLHGAAILMVAAFFVVARPELPRLATRSFAIVAVEDGVAHPSDARAPAAIRVSVPAPKPAEISAASPAPEPPRESSPPARAVSSRPRMTLDEFHRTHPAALAPDKAPLAPAPRVSESFPVERGAVTRADDKSDQSFATALLDDLRQAFESSGVSGRGMAATVEFSLRADGGLSNARIRQSSGTPEFDAAVLAAMKKVRAHGFPRDAAGKSYEVVFRTVDD